MVPSRLGCRLRRTPSVRKGNHVARSSTVVGTRASRVPAESAAADVSVGVAGADAVAARAVRAGGGAAAAAAGDAGDSGGDASPTGRGGVESPIGVPFTRESGAAAAAKAHRSIAEKVADNAAKRKHRKAVADAKRKTKREAAVARAKQRKSEQIAERKAKETPEQKHARASAQQRTRKINARRRELGRERTAVKRAKAQVDKVASAILDGAIIQDAPAILDTPTQPLTAEIGPLIARKLKAIGARLRDSSLRGDRDPDTGRSVIPPAELMSLPGVQTLALAVRFLPGGRDRFVEYIQLGALNADDTCLRFWQIWAELTPAERQTASFDDVVAAGGIKPADLLAAMVKHAVNFGTDVGRLVYAAAHPQVIDASIQSALKLESTIGQVDRLRLLEAQGFLPVVQKGPVVSISASAQAAAGAMAATAGQPAAVLSPFQAALQAANVARDAAVDAVIVESDSQRAEMKQLAAPGVDPFKAAMAAGVDAREIDALQVAADGLTGRRAG